MTLQAAPLDSAFNGLLGGKPATLSVRPAMNPQADVYPGSYLPVTEKMCTTCVPVPEELKHACAACAK